MPSTEPAIVKMADALTRQHGVVVPREPTYEMLMVILGDPIIMAASDEQNAREWYARLLAAAEGK